MNKKRKRKKERKYCHITLIKYYRAMKYLKVVFNLTFYQEIKKNSREMGKRWKFREKIEKEIRKYFERNFPKELPPFHDSHVFHTHIIQHGVDLYRFDIDSRYYLLGSTIVKYFPNSWKFPNFPKIHKFLEIFH